MSENTNYLTRKRVSFYSELDEKIFFDWIKQIKCIAKFEGAGDELYLDLVPTELNYDDMKDLIALFFRYKINMKQLARLKNKKNEGALLPWGREIFGIKKQNKK